MWCLDFHTFTADIKQVVCIDVLSRQLITCTGHRSNQLFHEDTSANYTRPSGACGKILNIKPLHDNIADECCACLLGCPLLVVKVLT